MSKRTLVLLLIVSVAFNLAVLFGFFWHKAHRPEPPRHRERTSPRAEMPERINWREYSPQLVQYRNEFDDTKLQLMKELSKATVDEGEIERIIELSLQAQNNLERELGMRLLHFRKQMTAEEAEAHFGNRIQHLTQRKNYRQNSRRNSHEENTHTRPDRRSRARDTDSTKSPR